MEAYLDKNKIYSLIELYKAFDDEVVCRKYLEAVRWGNTPVCPRCSSIDTLWYKHGKQVMCRSCRHHFSVTSGTLFDNTKISLQKWLLMTYTFCHTNKNISSKQFCKDFGVTQATAWQMSNKIRSLFCEQKDWLLEGIIEIDECFVSKVGRWSPWYRNERKSPVIGIKQRDGEVRIFSVKDRSRETIETLIRDNVAEGSTIYTDGAKCYKALYKWYQHDFVNHKEGEYVSVENFDVHTQSIESVWSQLKKNIRGAHHSVSQKHLQKYCDEIAYRYNNKHLSPVEKFNDLLKRACEGTYKQREAMYLNVA